MPKSLSMISWELDPFRTRGGTAYAIRRLADQLTNLGIETRVLLPDGPDLYVEENVQPLLKPVFVKMPADIDRYSRGQQGVEFCRVVLAELSNADSEVVIGHSLESALSIVALSEHWARSKSVFWLHSLYDPPLESLAFEHRRDLPCPNLLASAVTLADIVVTSSGILKDVEDFEWPPRLSGLQRALSEAKRKGRVLTVESTGCLPNHSSESSTSEQQVIPSPYVFFPGRPSVDKGLGFFAAIAERLSADKITCVAVQRPTQSVSENPSLNTSIQWLPWLTQDELVEVMRKSLCTVLPSLAEGFGLAAAESLNLGVTTLFHEVGGHHALSKLSNAIPVSLTSSERSQLYRLWSDLFGSDDYWSVWGKYEMLFEPLIERWVDSIRIVLRNESLKGSESFERPVEDQWGTKLLHAIETAACTSDHQVVAIASGQGNNSGPKHTN